MIISSELLGNFKRDGAVKIPAAFSAEQIEWLREGVDWVMQNPSTASESLGDKKSEGVFFNDYCNWQKSPPLKKFIYHSGAAKLAAALMDSSKAIFYHEHVLVKELHASAPTPWHHDQPYYPVDGNQVCSLWIPTTSVPRATSLKFVAGSHLWDQWFIPQKFATQKKYTLLKKKASAFDKHPYTELPPIHEAREKILCWALEPGDCVAFHMRTLHGAAGNTKGATGTRAAVALRWCGEDAVFAERPWDISPPITGGLRPGESMECETFPLIYSQS